MKLLINKKIHHDYEVIKSFQAGVVLTGPEVKSLRQKHGSLRGSFIKLLSGKALLVGAQINPYAYADNTDYDPTRSRQLLLHRKELALIDEASSRKGVSIVPLSWEVVGKNIKLNLAIARGKKEYEKRELLKKKTQRREIEQQVRTAKYRG